MKNINYIGTINKNILRFKELAYCFNKYKNFKQPKELFYHSVEYYNNLKLDAKRF